jgi:hypothetical protein
MKINSETEMKEFTLDIIQTLHKEKKKRNIVPDFVLSGEVLQFIRSKVNRALKGFEKDEKIRIGETINNRYYEIIENKKQ